MFEIITQEKKINIEYRENQFYINKTLADFKIVKIKSNHFHIIGNHKSYLAETIAIDQDKKKITVKINNQLFILDIKTKLDLLIDKLGMSNSSSAQFNQLKAPMPGLILDIKVSEKTEVKKGDPLLILEAMKMENMIKSPIDGIIKRIHIKKGQSVEKNQLLIEF